MADTQRRSPAGRLGLPDGWALDRDGFDGLLRFLDPDRDRAAGRYEEIRRRLFKLFAWRGCLAPDEYVDRTLDRVARRLAEGADIHVTDPYQYVHGVALNVLREYWREPGRLWEMRTHTTEVTTEISEGAMEGRLQLERALSCLEACLARLPPRSRALLLDYHAESNRIERRRQLAASLGIPLNALRIRVHRIRGAVERCVIDRSRFWADETNSARPHQQSDTVSRHDRRDDRAPHTVSPGSAADL